MRWSWVFAVFFGILIGLLPSRAWSQKPGKERIILDFPSDLLWKQARWSMQKIKKDTPSIREYIWTPKEVEKSDYPVKQIDILTIDKRYYPLSAKENVEEKWKFRQSQCPGSSLDIVYQNRDEKGLMIVFILRNQKNIPENSCDLPAWILLAAEGPTAFHSVEIQIEESQYTPELAQIWIEILKNRSLK